MAADSKMVNLCADLLRGGFTTPERVAAFLVDADASELAAQLAERRGTTSFAGAIGEEGRARLTNLAARALALRLTDPDHLRTVTLSAMEGAEEMVQIAVGLARRRMRDHPNYRPIEDWESDPAARAAAPVIERDPVTGQAIGPLASTLQAEPVETRPRRDLTACGRGAHRYGEVDPASGWSTCLSCGHVLVVDRRPGPGGLLAGPTGFAPQLPNPFRP